MKAAFVRGWRPLAAFFGSSFVLHLLWENLQAPLYSCYQSFWQCFWICLYATATGDMIFMLTIYAALAVIHRDWQWVRDPGAYRHPATWILAVGIGLILAVSFELWAVHVAHRWQYTEFMLIVPFVQIGLTPVLQMIIIPLLAIYSSCYAIRAIEKKG